jgi:hypothetical protein
MSLNDLLGEGATESLDQALRISDKTLIFYSNWEYTAPEIITLDNINLPKDQIDYDPWPGPGVWKRVTVVWESESQDLYFQKQEDSKVLMIWGSGLCDRTSDAPIKNLASQEMKTFAATYVDDMKIFLPNEEGFYGRFLLAGFEKGEIKNDEITLFASLKDPNSRMAELFQWRFDGAKPEDEPAWRAEARQEIGLETLFPERS